MRRGVSIAVLLVLLTTTLAQLAQASASSLPVCCRVRGKHLCEMSMGASALGGFQSAPQPCPFRIHAAVMPPLVALAASGHRTAAVVQIDEAAHPTELTHHANFSGDTHKRGPPIA